MYLNSFSRIPQWLVAVHRPDFSVNGLVYKKVPEWSKSGSPVDMVAFSSSREIASRHNAYNDLIEYSYSNDIGDPSGQFSLTFVPSVDSVGRGWKEKLNKMDIVVIQEFEKSRFVGVILDVRYSMEISSGKPKRTVSVTGLSFGGMIRGYNLSMNVYLWYGNGQTAESLNTDLVQALNSKVNETQDLNKILSVITEKFFSVVFGSQELKGFLFWVNKFVKFDTATLESYYPRIFSVFEVQSNNLWDIYRKVLTSPIYEIFGKFNPVDDSYVITCRETPFDYDDWNALPIKKIDPLHLVSHSFSKGSDPVYTHYYSTMPNAEFSENENNARADLQNVSQFDYPRLWVYGYNQLQAMFTFYNVDRGNDIDFSSEQFLKDNSVRMYNWFNHNDEFESGEIVLMNVPDENNDMIDVGERISFIGGEFYMEKYTRSMSYPSSMKTTLKVTRGYEYGKTPLSIDGTIQIDSRGSIVYSPHKGPIRNVMQKLVNVEKEGVNG